MYNIILTLHVIVCCLVILVVLVQSGKGAGISNIFGGGGGDALFSAPSGSLFIRKVTTGFAIAFFTTCVVLTFLSSRRTIPTVTQGVDFTPTSEAPAAPPPPPAAPTTKP